jgi:hypothetical protein
MNPLTRVATLVTFSLLALWGCGELDPLLGTEISGTVHGESYTFVSGTAESSMNGFVLTLADDPDFDCASTPPGRYLTIVIGGVEQVGSFDAVGNVSFNLVDDEINHTEGATSGTVVIDVLDPDDQGVISGEVDLLGPESDVYGTFSVPFCMS